MYLNIGINIYIIVLLKNDTMDIPWFTEVYHCTYFIFMFLSDVEFNYMEEGFYFKKY